MIFKNRQRIRPSFTDQAGNKTKTLKALLQKMFIKMNSLRIMNSKRFITLSQKHRKNAILKKKNFIAKANSDNQHYISCISVTSYVLLKHVTIFINWLLMLLTILHENILITSQEKKTQHITHTLRTCL